MTIIKLDATDSTNDFLKQLAQDYELDDFTIVLAKEQTNGKGQMGAKWVSEPGQNLTMSVLIKDLHVDEVSIFDVNAAASVAAINTLSMSYYPHGKIKWPNDIMAENKKIGGILIENTFKPDGVYHSIIGFGLNLNQTHFENLPQASSLSKLTGKTYDVEEMAELFARMLFIQILLPPFNVKELWSDYNGFLFKRHKAVAFEDTTGKRFMAIVKKVTRDGKLLLLQNDDQLHYYENKQIKMLF